MGETYFRNEPIFEAMGFGSAILRVSDFFKWGVTAMRKVRHL
jgi:hypothetical protein